MFVEVKIHCGCGARYKFDVEPLHGLMPAKVNCPVCGVDGTEAGNALLREKLAPAAPPPPAPATDVEVIPPAPRTASQSSLAVIAAEPIASRSPADPAVSRMETPRFAPRPQLVPGIAGAILAAGIGGAGWFALLAFTGFELGFAAWGVGLLTGFVTRQLGRAGTLALGIVASVCALLAVAAGRFMAALQVSGALPLWTVAAQSFGWLTGLWLLLASASAFRLASR